MCLRSKTNIPEIAKEDIVCYKIIEERSNNKYVSPYTKDEIIFNKIIIASKSTKAFKIPKIITLDLTVIAYCIEEGFFHAFQTKEIARDFHSCFIDCITHIVKCIIPKGSRYFVSVGNTEICADRMMITDEIIYRYY